MRRLAILALGLSAAACGGPTAQPAATPSPPAALAPSASPSGSPTVSPSPSAPGAVQARCTASIPARHPLALLTLAGSDAPVLADLSDPRHPSTLCVISGQGQALRLISATELSYATASPGSPGSIATLELTTNSGGTVASWTGGAFASGAYAWSPDGSTLAYLASSGTAVELHLVANEDDRTIATLPPVGGRGISPDDDNLLLAFSPDDKYLAMVQTFTGGATGGDAPFQVRRLDGSLVTGGPAGRTMATWAGSGSTLYFRDHAGVERWTAASAVSTVLPSVRWIRPRPSPDGRWITFAQRDAAGLPSVELLDLTRPGPARQLASGGAEPVFLTPTTLWFRQERLCGPGDTCEIGPPSIPTGATFLYDLGTGRATPSTITGVLDTFTPAG